MKKKSILVVLLSGALLGPAGAFGQQEGEGARAGALSVFLECAARGCEASHYRTEITYVNWVRDVQDSQVHVIMTSSTTGSGDQYMLDFIGRGELEGEDDRLTYSHSDTDTDFQRSQGLTGVLAVGLAHYSLLLGQPVQFTVSTPVEDDDRRTELPPGLQGDVQDPWDYWVFNVGGDIRFEDEDRKDEKRYSANLSANPVSYTHLRAHET